MKFTCTRSDLVLLFLFRKLTISDNPTYGDLRRLKFLYGGLINAENGKSGFWIFKNLDKQTALTGRNHRKVNLRTRTNTNENCINFTHPSKFSIHSKNMWVEDITLPVSFEFSIAIKLD